MNREISRGQWLLFALGCAAMASIVFALRTKASSADEIPRLAALMDWKPGVVVADIGAEMEVTHSLPWNMLTKRER